MAATEDLLPSPAHPGRWAGHCLTSPSRAENTSSPTPKRGHTLQPRLPDLVSVPWFGSSLLAPLSAPRLGSPLRPSFGFPLDPWFDPLGSRTTQSSCTYRGRASGSVFRARGASSALPDAGMCCLGNYHRGNQHGRARVREPREPLKIKLTVRRLQGRPMELHTPAGHEKAKCP